MYLKNIIFVLMGLYLQQVKCQMPQANEIGYRFMKAALEAIEAKDGLESEGTWRQSGLASCGKNETLVRALKHFKKPKNGALSNYILKTCGARNDIISLVKAFFRELPRPIFHNENMATIGPENVATEMSPGEQRIGHLLLKHLNRYQKGVEIPSPPAADEQALSSDGGEMSPSSSGYSSKGSPSSPGGRKFSFPFFKNGGESPKPSSDSEKSPTFKSHMPLEKEPKNVPNKSLAKKPDDPRQFVVAADEITKGKDNLKKTRPSIR